MAVAVEHREDEVRLEAVVEVVPVVVPRSSSSLIDMPEFSLHEVKRIY